MKKEFLEYSYFPGLRTRPAEMLGYQKLTDDVKGDLLPLFTLGLWPRQDSLKRSMEEAQAAIGGGNFILDLTKEPTYQTDDLKKLLNPSDGFAAWRKYALAQSNVIPVVQFGARLPDVIKQARYFSNAGQHKLAVRIQDFQEDVPKAVSVLAALDSADQCLVFLDLGYVRDTMSASIAAAITAINDIREDIPEALICVMSSSFPNSVTSFVKAGTSGKSGVIEILEKNLYEEIGSEAALYGDYGSIHGRVYLSTGGRYVPRIDYPLEDAWVFERRPDTDAQGYVSAAKALLKDHPEISDDDTWGAEQIVAAAKGKIDGMKTPASWIAARVNMHISRQAFALRGHDGEDDEDLEF